MTERNWSTGMSVIRPTLLNPGAVDHDVERAGVVEEPLHRVFVGDVDRNGGVRRSEVVGPVAGAVGVAVGDDDPAAVGGQRLRGRPADPGGSADDDRDAFSVHATYLLAKLYSATRFPGAPVASCSLARSDQRAAGGTQCRADPCDNHLRPVAQQVITDSDDDPTETFEFGGAVDVLRAL